MVTANLHYITTQVEEVNIHSGLTILYSLFSRTMEIKDIPLKMYNILILHV